MTELDQTGTTSSPSQQGGEDKRPPDRRCQGVKGDGSACTAWTVQGESYCAGHLGLGVAAGGDVARAAQRQGARDRSEQLRKAKRAPQAVYRDAVTEHAEEFVRARLEIIRDPKASASDRLAAMSALENRALGKPDQPTTHVVEMPDDFQVLRTMSREDLGALYRQLQADGALARGLPAGEEAAELLGYEDEPLPDQ